MQRKGSTAPPGSGGGPAPDQELVARVLAGEAEHYAALVDRYQDGLYRHALGMVLDSDVAADLVQDAFVRAYENLRRCRDGSKFGTWIFQILRNRTLDYLKERRRQDLPLDNHNQIPATYGSPEAALEQLALRDLLEHALAQLPEMQREAFLLKHLQGLTYEEMAELVGASVSALRMRVLRAREQLQELLGETVNAMQGRM